MANLVAQSISLQGTNPTTTAASGGGDTVPAGDNVFLVVQNGGGGAVNVTVVVPGTTSYGENKPDPVINVPAGEDRWIGMRGEFADPTTGRISITYDGVTSVTVGAFRI